MDNINRFILSRSISQVYFWVVIAVPYLLYRGLSTEEVYTVISFYAISIVLLEYPTGVIGDHYGHKLSVLLGIVTAGVAAILLAQDYDGIYFYLFASFVNALGSSFISGSDTAILKSISSDFAKDFRTEKLVSTVTFILVSITGGYIASVSFELALYITALASITGALLLQTVSVPTNTSTRNKHQGDIFSTARRGIKILLHDHSLFLVAFHLAVIDTVIISIKSIFGSFQEVFSSSTEVIGWLIALGLISRLMAISFASRINSMQRILYTASLVLLAIGSTQSSIVLASVSLLVLHFTTVVVSFNSQVTINEYLEDSYRASILSAINLQTRLISSIYLVGFGIFVGGYSYQGYMVITAVALIGLEVIYKVLKKPS